MLSNSYLYGVEEVPEIPKEVVTTRIKLLKANLQTVVDIHYSKRDYKRQEDILKAIKFWENLNNGKST